MAWKSRRACLGRVWGETRHWPAAQARRVRFSIRCSAVAACLPACLSARLPALSSAPHHHVLPPSSIHSSSTTPVSATDPSALRRFPSLHIHLSTSFLTWLVFFSVVSDSVAVPSPPDSLARSRRRRSPSLQTRVSDLPRRVGYAYMTRSAHRLTIPTPSSRLLHASRPLVVVSRPCSRRHHP